MTAREINELIRDGQRHGRNVYAEYALSTIGVAQPETRIVKAKTDDGFVKVQTLGTGRWLTVSASTLISWR